MTKHDNYNRVCEITITKHNDNSYELKYLDENWVLSASKEEILEELGGHMELMKGDKQR